MTVAKNRKMTDFQRGVELFLRIARKRVQELQAKEITVKDAIEQSLQKKRIEAEDSLTASYFSRILSGKLSPKTEETYDKIAAILEIPTLFDVRSFLLPHDKKAIRISHKGYETLPDEWLTIPFEGVPYFTPKANIIDSQMCPFVVELSPAEKTKKGKYKAEPGEEVAILLQGDEFTIFFEGKDPCVIRKGESAHYLTTQPHYTQNTGKTTARILVVRSEPSLYRLISEAFRSAEGR